MRFPIGAHVKVREDLVSGNSYYMDDKRTRDSFVGQMCRYRGYEFIVSGYQANKYKLESVQGSSTSVSLYFWTDEMLEDIVTYELSDLPSLASLFDT